MSELDNALVDVFYQMSAPLEDITIKAALVELSGIEDSPIMEARLAFAKRLAVRGPARAREGADGGELRRNEVVERFRSYMRDESESEQFMRKAKVKATGVVETWEPYETALQALFARVAETVPQTWEEWHLHVSMTTAAQVLVSGAVMYFEPEFFEVLSDLLDVIEVNLARAAHTDSSGEGA